MEIISSKDNKKVKEARKLLTKKYRKNSYLIEGFHLLEEALKAGHSIHPVHSGLHRVGGVSRPVDSGHQSPALHRRGKPLLLLQNRAVFRLVSEQGNVLMAEARQMPHR